MRGLLPERFSVIRTLRENHLFKTFVADDLFLERENVLVKLIKKDYVSRDELIRRFSWLIGIKHRHFSSVLDVGITRQKHFFYVRDYLPPSELLFSDPIPVMKSLLSAVHFLRRHDFVHGAIKPSNIFYTNDMFKLADANCVSTAIHDEADSVHFTAPEVLRGREISHEGDLYSLGAVLYLILTGRHLFEDADLARLKSKYVTAIPQIAPFLLPVPQSAFEMVLVLLGSNREKRSEAFEALLRIIKPVLTTAEKVCLVGREDVLAEVSQQLQQSVRTLRALLLQGEAGSGKSRLILELRLHCAIRGYSLVICHCKPTSAELMPIREGLNKFEIPSNKTDSNVEHSQISPIHAEYVARQSSASHQTNYVRGKAISDLISLMISRARQAPMVLVVEDIHWADAGTVRFLEQLAFREAEAPLLLVLTQRTGPSESPVVQTMAACLRHNFLRLRLRPLSQYEERRMLNLLDVEHQQQLAVVKSAAGNPLFVEHYAKLPKHANLDPPAVNAAVVAILSGLSKRTLSVLQHLSVFQQPISTSILGTLFDNSPHYLQPELTLALELGLISQHAEAVQIRFPIIRTQVYRSIHKKKRIELNRQAFSSLKDIECDKAALGHYAFEAAMFNEAEILYQELARDAFEVRNHRSALAYYERLQQCCQGLGKSLAPNDVLNLALCYDRIGKQLFSERLYHDLLTQTQVQADPNLRSLVYIRLARWSTGLSVKARTALLEMSLKCLPNDSSHIQRHTQVCHTLLTLGDSSKANEVLRELEANVLRHGHSASVLDGLRAMVFLNQGEFALAVQYYMNRGKDDIGELAALNNLGVCFEHLGHLQKALEYNCRARDYAIATGNDIVAQVLSVNNIAAIRTKRGELQEAEYLFSQALHSLRTAGIADILTQNSLAQTVASDAAINALYRGDYKRAYECVKYKRESCTTLVDFDRLLCEIIRCKCLVELGVSRKAHQFLQMLKEAPIFRVDYFHIERALVETYVPEIPLKERIEGVERALVLSRKLGTLYQECELLIALTLLCLECDEGQKAEKYIGLALDLANKNGYRLLAARGHLLHGIACEKQEDKEHSLSECFTQANEIGLQELIAESSYYLGILHLESGNTITGREYLIRSTSLTLRLAEGVPLTARSKYLAKKWRRDAVLALDRCNESIPLSAIAMFSGDGDKYFTAAYQFTMSAAASTSIELLLNVMSKTLNAACARSAVIRLKSGADVHSIPIRIKVTPELTERIDLVRNRSKNRVFFESADEKGKRAHAWIPLNSDTCQGGVYVMCRSQESPFAEREMELFTMMGTIANSALKRLETRNAHETEPRDLSEFHGIIGTSKAIREVYSQIEMSARNVATVLIEGDSGTGKELVAKAIHAAGPRAKEPFIAVDCGAIPETLIEAELFGSKKGSYTGAIADRPGLFEAAHRGTIFLDEISNTTPALQAKLLRVIQEREVRRLGETKGRSVDVRLIVASNQNLTVLADSGQFRKDLLYRLKVLHIKVPALRSRRDDIPMLAHAFLKRLNSSNNARKYFAPNVVSQLCTQKFPGNVRELQNAIERAFFLAKGIMITEVPLETHSQAQAGATAGVGPLDEIQTWFKDISEGRKDFWTAIQNRYKHRDISREKVVALVDFGLRSTRGSYKTMASMFHLREKDYRRFMDFLRRNECLLDFRPYRKAAAASHES